MVFQSVRLQNFRSYEDFAVELSPSVTIVVGPNASGKTNFLEALLFIATGESYRSDDLMVLLRHGSDWSRIDALKSDNSQRTVKISQGKTGRFIQSITSDDVPIKKQLLDSYIPVILFEPKDIQLMSGSPELRRGLLDSLLTQINAEYSIALKEYKRILRQRNTLLKSKQTNIAHTIFPWNIRLIECAEKIAQNRIALIELLNKNITNHYNEISQKKHSLKINYLSKVPLSNYGSHLLKELELRLELDIIRGYTSVGPHRDDFEVIIDNITADHTASRGETRTIVLSLKLLSMEILREKRGQAPLLLLDDVFSELDGSRRRALTQFLKPYQTIITTTDADIVTKDFAQQATIISPL